MIITYSLSRTSCVIEVASNIKVQRSRTKSIQTSRLFHGIRFFTVSLIGSRFACRTDHCDVAFGNFSECSRRRESLSRTFPRKVERGRSRRVEAERTDGTDFQDAIKDSRARRFLINVKSRREMASPLPPCSSDLERSRPCRAGDESPIENRSSRQRPVTASITGAF